MNIEPILPELRKLITAFGIDLYGDIDFESARIINGILDRLEYGYLRKKFIVAKCSICHRAIVRSNKGNRFSCFECKSAAMKEYNRRH